MVLNTTFPTECCEKISGILPMLFPVFTLEVPKSQYQWRQWHLPSTVDSH